MDAEMDDATRQALELAEEIERKERATRTSGAVDSAASTPKGKARSAPVDPKTLLGDDQLKGLRSEGACGSCGTTVARTESKVSLFSMQPRDEIYRCAHVTCPSCVTALCSGCFEPSGCEVDCESDQANGCASVIHCSKVRAVLAFEALAALDRLYCPQALKRPASSASDASKKPRASTTTANGKAGPTAGIGYGYDDADSGITARRGTAISAEQTEAVQIATAVDARRDQLLTLALKIVGELMPHPDSDDAEIFDFCPEPTLRPLVLLSSMPELLSELMRNDSITSISERSKLYLAMLAFLSDLAASDAMVDLLIERRRVKAFSDGIGELVRGRGDVEWERTVAPGGTPPASGPRKRALSASQEAEVVVAAPLAHHLRKLIRQAKLYSTISADKPTVPPLAGTLAAASPVPLLPPDEEALQAAKEIRELAERFVADGKRIEEAVLDRKSADDLAAATADADAATAPVTTGAAFSSVDSRYAEACEELSFAMIDLSRRGGSSVTLQHVYSAQLLGSLQMATKNATHLNKELATLATSLPPGIFLRVDESRLNALKCLIAGPADTPYADGLFEFDLMLGYDYPISSPQCTLRTTAGGRVRFNPNLYANGKTCLSLLGTWPGRPEENWQPWRSTLLQVFMSINSLIMNEYPYYNEPSYGHPHDSTESRGYNKNVALQNVRWAMLDWMQDSHKTGIWAEVIKMHFATKRSVIKAQIAKWAALDDRMHHYDESTCPSCGTPQASRAPVTGGLDLVAEFDRRCDAIAQWTVPSSS